MSAARMSPVIASSPAVCTVRRKLAEEFATAARLFSEAAANFGQSGHMEEEHAHLRAAVLGAQKRSEVAFASYEAHLESHHCCVTSVMRNAIGR